MPEVSVIVPNYNHAKYLKERIESILNQKYQDFELIIIDDNSFDSSREVIEYYADNPLISHIVINEKNSGSPFGNWVLGFDLAKGKYIWIAESDDFADCHFLEKTVNLMKKNPATGIVYTDSYIINENSDLRGRWRTIKNERFKCQKWNQDYENEGKQELIENMLIFMTINNMSSCLLRKRCIPPMHLVQSFKGAGDWLFCALILLEHNIHNISKPLNYYREHNNNITNINDRIGLLLVENMRFYSIILTELKKRNIYYSNKFYKILDRFLFKYIRTKNIQPIKKREIRKYMIKVSFMFYLKFEYMLIKHQIKQNLGFKPRKQ